MDDLHAQVKLVRGNSGKTQVVVTVRNKNGTLSRMSTPLQDPSKINSIVQEAIAKAEKFGQTHESTMQNPNAVDMASGVD